MDPDDFKLQPTDPDVIGIEQVAEAVRVLSAYCAKEESVVETTIGKRIGYALYSQCGPQICIAIAREMLEQWNDHLVVALMDMVHHGAHATKCPRNDERYENTGYYQRSGRKMTVTLPEWWAKL